MQGDTHETDLSDGSSLDLVHVTETFAMAIGAILGEVPSYTFMEGILRDWFYAAIPHGTNERTPIN